MSRTNIKPFSFLIEPMDELVRHLDILGSNMVLVDKTRLGVSSTLDYGKNSVTIQTGKKNKYPEI